MCRSADPRRAMDAQPDVPAVAPRRVARVQADAHPKVAARRPRLAREPALHLRGGGDRIARLREHEEVRVPRALIW